MWWITDRREQRKPVRFEQSFLVQNMAQQKPLKSKPLVSIPEPSKPSPKQRRLRLPISIAQAAANLILQESGADCHAEIPRLRRDLRALEAGLRDQANERNQVAHALLSARDQARLQMERIGNLETQLEVSNVKCDHAQLRSGEQQKWLMLAASLSSTSEHQKRAGDLESQQQVADLLEMLAAARSENRRLVDQLETRERENRIFSDVIDDMESRRERELKLQRQRKEEREKGRRSLGDPERAEVQQLNLRIVCQAAEIRSLNKKVADLQSDVDCEVNDYRTVLDAQNHDYAGEDNRRIIQLNARLENSLHAVRVELDSAVHELKYANAETLRLKDHAACMEKKYESELLSLVQLAELHAMNAARLEHRLLMACEREPVVAEHGTPEPEVWEEIIAQNQRLSQAMVRREQDLRSPAVRVQQLEIEVLELQEANQEIQSLRESQAKVSGENETLSAINDELSQRSDAMQTQFADFTERHAQEKSEWNSLLRHHEQNTHVAQAECALMKNQIEELQATHETTRKQQLEVIECLKTDLVAYRTRQAALQSELEGEQLHRIIADREIQRLVNDAARILDVHATEREHSKQGSKQDRDEQGGGSSVRSVA
jgi:hypothetical protein